MNEVPGSFATVYLAYYLDVRDMIIMHLLHLVVNVHIQYIPRKCKRSAFCYTPRNEV